jgi:hypothetical protein
MYSGLIYFEGSQLFLAVTSNKFFPGGI